MRERTLRLALAVPVGWREYIYASPIILQLDVLIRFFFWNIKEARRGRSLCTYATCYSSRSALQVDLHVSHGNTRRVPRSEPSSALMEEKNGFHCWRTITRESIVPNLTIQDWKCCLHLWRACGADARLFWLELVRSRAFQSIAIFYKRIKITISLFTH